MNRRLIESKATQFDGNAKEHSGRLMHGKFDINAGMRDQLVARIQETDGVTKEQAELQVKIFEDQVRAFDEMQ